MRIFAGVGAGVRSSCRLLVAAVAIAGCSGAPTPTGSSDSSSKISEPCVTDDGAFAEAGTVCRRSSGPCDLAEVCTGFSASCPPDRFRPADTLCRARSGACDVAETCTGSGPHCPADVFAIGGFVCRPSSGPCDLEETCTGKAAVCPTDRFLPPQTVCRHAARPCDVAESCSGSAPYCPSDVLLSSSNVCREAQGPCEVAESCTGSAPSCPADELLPASTVCREALGSCDVAESCTGSAPSCPADVLISSGTLCREAFGACDVVESCTGSEPTSPADALVSAGTVCRDAQGSCDVAEACTGSSASCPADLLLSSSKICREAQGPCDVEERCTGSSSSCPADALLGATAVCRQSTGTCDVAERCTGTEVSCPGDTFSATGSTCAQDGGNACDGHGACVACANYCQQQVTCSGTATTSVSGTVFIPNGVDPLPNTLVYVPNATVQPLPSGVQGCEPCSNLVTGAPLVSTTTDAAGRFKLTNMPAGQDIPLVIQNGKWRREFVLPSVPSCVDTALPTSGPRQLRMPKNRGEGNIPRIAIVTGGFAALECVLLKLGLEAQEFGNGGPSFPGRVHFYLADGNPGAHFDSATPIETELWASQSNLNAYDLVFFGCQGSRFHRSLVAQQKLINYANSGGQVIANHYAMEWLYNVAPFSSTALWNVDQPVSFSSDPQDAFIDTTYPPAQVLAQWLEHVAPSITPGQVPVSHLYADFDGATPPSRVWFSLHDALHPNPVPMQYTFDTPVGAPPGQQCGRVLFTEYHTMENLPDGTQFPSACNNAPLRPDERLMEFMVFDQGTCR